MSESKPVVAGVVLCVGSYWDRDYMGREFRAYWVARDGSHWSERMTNKEPVGHGWSEEDAVKQWTEAARRRGLI